MPHTLSSSASAATHCRSPAACQSVQVKAFQHRWSLCASTAAFIDDCYICQNALAPWYACLEERHCVCQNCHDQLRYDRRLAPDSCCRNSSSTAGTLRDLNAKRAKKLALVAVNCDECHGWSGSAYELRQHAGECTRQQTSRQNPAAGGTGQWPQQDSQARQSEYNARKRPPSDGIASLSECMDTTAPTVMPTDDKSTECGQGCGQKLPRREMQAHYRVCSLSLVSCSACQQNLVRRDFPAHAEICDYRVVPCPYGCEMTGLLARTVNRGTHALMCPENPQHCSYCNNWIVFEEFDKHRGLCDMRPVDCVWCLATHPAGKAIKLSAECYKALAGPVIFYGQTLQLSDEATGPVYITQEKTYDPVFIKLPMQKLLDTEKAAPSNRSAFSFKLKFMWGKEWWEMVALSWNQVRLEVQLLPWMKKKATTTTVQLYSASGQQLGTWDNTGTCPNVSPLEANFKGGVAFSFQVAGRISACGGSHVFFRLGPLACT
ncbi:MAG: hypothetical protein OXC07_01520 [Kistimonas sp.]|nr:hypothetical protein [Kistimonas sp.]